MLLRPYQQTAVDRMISRRNLNPLLALATGGGKTVCGTRFVTAMAVLGFKILWMVHRKELVEQASATLLKCGLKNGIVMAKCKPDYDSSIQVASIQTLTRRMDKLSAPDYIIIDEAHHATANSYQKIFDQWPRANRIGLTATPYRMDGSGLGGIFNHAIVGASIKSLVNDGYLVAPKSYCMPIPEGLKSIGLTRGEFDARIIAQVMTERVILGDVRKHWIDLAFNRRTICFASTVEQSQKIVENFRQLRIPAEHLDGKTPKNEREEILARLASGETKIVSNVGVLTEGFDCPAVSCIILCRLTSSLALFKQMVGRCMRVADGINDAIVLDHCGNTFLHGNVTEEADWSLEGITKRPIEGTGLKICPICFLSARNTAKECLGCGELFSATMMKRQTCLKVKRGRLVEYEEPKEFLQKTYWDNLLKLGYKSKDAIPLYIKEFSENPILLNNKLIIPSSATMEEKKGIWLNHYRFTGSSKAADQKYLQIFGVYARGKNKWYSEYLMEVDKELREIAK